jgi:MarR family transcriptional regulator, temperature-dependent positive regulator of motility
MSKLDSNYTIFKMLNENKHLTQRQIAKQLNFSLGKTNYLIRALIDSGWVKVNNFKRSDNKKAYMYILTPSGMYQKTKITKQFLERKLMEYDKLKKEIELLKKEEKEISEYIDK